MPLTEKRRPTKIIDRGVKIIRENRGSAHIRSQLQEILEQAASGDSPANSAAFFECFTELLRTSSPFSGFGAQGSIFSG